MVRQSQKLSNKPVIPGEPQPQLRRGQGTQVLGTISGGGDRTPDLRAESTSIPFPRFAPQNAPGMTVWAKGDPLVVDTIGQKVGPLSMVDLYGTSRAPTSRISE